MTRYTVVWVQSVEDELVELWLATNDRNDVTAATHAFQGAQGPGIFQAQQQLP